MSLNRSLFQGIWFFTDELDKDEKVSDAAFTTRLSTEISVILFKMRPEAFRAPRVTPTSGQTSGSFSFLE